jgi:ligand-binding sensor domain-containing protein
LINTAINQVSVYSLAKISSIAVLLFLLSCCTVLAQKLSVKHITVNEGLPSNETFCLYQKGIGELYIGTEFGLVQYDGEEFRQVPFEDKKYNGAMVFEIKPDKENVLWIKTYRDGLFYLRNDTLRPFVGNNNIRALIKENMLGELKFDNNSNLWFTLSFYPNTVFKVSIKTGKVTKIPVPTSTTSVAVNLVIYKIDAATSIVVNTDKKPDCTNNNYKITEEKTNIYITTNKDFCYPYTRPETFIHTNDGFIISFNSKLVRWNRVTGKVQVTAMKSEILHLLNDNNNIIIACKNGAYLLNKVTGQVKTILENQQVTNVLKDKEGIYWFSTNSGLVYMPSIDIYQLSSSEPGFNILAIAGENGSGRMATVTMDGTLSFYRDRNSTITAEQKIEGRLEKMYPKKLVWLDSQMIVYSHAYYDVRNNKEETLSGNLKGAILDIEEDESKSKLLFAYKRGFSIYKIKESNSNQQVYCPELFCRAIAEYENKIYLGGDLGLYRVDNFNAARIFTEKINFQVNDIKAIGKKKLIVATRGGGIFIIEGDSVSQLSLNNGLSSDFCTRIIIENETTFWAGSNKGLNRIIIQPDGYKIDKWFVEDGLVSDKITDLTRTGNNLFILTDQGINYFNPSKITASKPQLYIHLKSLKIDGELQKPGNGIIHVKPGERDLQFDFKIPGFRKGRNIQLRYILHGEDQILSQTGGQSITYKELSPGKYTLHIQVIGVGGKEIGPVLVYDILVEPRFYETRWFWIVLITTVALLVVLGVVIMLRRSEKERKRKWEYANAQLEALNMQMNPHFIFNALGNIQSLVFGENKLLANNFVVGLSELFRKVLMNANTNLITLSTEIEMLKEYIDLEMLRLENDSFEYSITIDPQLTINHERIPPLLVQPIVENAIWHGLLPAKRRGFLK